MTARERTCRCGRALIRWLGVIGNGTLTCETCGATEESCRCRPVLVVVCR